MDTNYNHTVDYFHFTLSGTGSLDVQLETFNGEFDPVMYLFVDDGDLTADDYIAYDDDSGTPAVWFSNSKITTNLLAGNYLTAVSHYWLSPSDAIDGSNSGINYVDDGGYDLVISSDLGTMTTGSAPVPEPSTILLLGLGLIGVAGYGRKRFIKKG